MDRFVGPVGLRSVNARRCNSYWSMLSFGERAYRVCKKNSFRRSSLLPGMTSGWDFSLSVLVKTMFKNSAKCERRHTKVSCSCRLCLLFFFVSFEKYVLGPARKQREELSRCVQFRRCHERLVSFSVSCLTKSKGWCGVCPCRVEDTEKDGWKKYGTLAADNTWQMCFPL